MTQELGPCPLCGGELANNGFDYGTMKKYLLCQSCGLDVPEPIMLQISALAAQTRRRGEALARAVKQLRSGDYSVEESARMCEEALKC